MKARILFILIVSLSVSVHSQKNRQVIEYNFKTGEYDKSNLNLRQKIPTVFKITNINPLFFTVKIDAEDKFISYENIEHTDLQKATSDIIPVLNPTIKETESIKEELLVVKLDNSTINANGKDDINEYNNLRVQLEKLKIDLQKNIEELENTSKTDTAKIEDNTKKRDSLKKEILDKESEISIEIKKQKTSVVLEKEILNNLRDLNNAYLTVVNNAREILKLNQNFNNYIDKINRPDLDYKTYDKLKKDSKTKNDSLEASYLLNPKNLQYAYGVTKVYKGNYQLFLNEYNNINNRKYIQQIKNIDKNGAFLYSIVNAEYERTKAAIQDIDAVILKINLSKKLNQLEIIDRELSKESTYSITSVPIQGIEDYLEFNITIEGKNKLADSYLTEKNKKFKYFEYLKGGVRFDFSVGTVFDFGAKDKIYEIIDNHPKEVSNNKFYPTLAGIFHASFRENGNFAGGISLGGSLDVTKFNIESLFIGPSLLIGKRDKVIFTIGPSFRKISELKSIYKEDTTLEENFDEKNLITQNFKVGFFIGLSYNLTNKQKGLMKIGN